MLVIITAMSVISIDPITIIVIIIIVIVIAIITYTYIPGRLTDVVKVPQTHAIDATAL